MYKKYFFLLFFTLIKLFYVFSEDDVFKIVGIKLNQQKYDLIYGLETSGWIQTESDKSIQSYPIEEYAFKKESESLFDTKIVNLCVCFCQNKSFLISVITEFSDLNSFIKLRENIKKEFSLKTLLYLDTDEYFYDEKIKNLSSYGSTQDENFILLIQYIENARGEICGIFHFFNKSDLEKAINLRNQYQKFSHIENYTTFTLEELEKKNEELEIEKAKEAEENRIKYQKDHKYDNVKNYFNSCGISGGYLNGGVYTGEMKGGFGAFEFSRKAIGPLFFGIDWRIGGVQFSIIDDMFYYSSKELKCMRTDIDAYIAIGVALSNKNDNNPVIYAAFAPGGLACFAHDKNDSRFDFFFDARIGIDIPFDSLSLKLTYSREFTNNNGQQNIITFGFGGRF